jgi:hypothetical protein
MITAGLLLTQLTLNLCSYFTQRRHLLLGPECSSHFTWPLTPPTAVTVAQQVSQCTAQRHSSRHRDKRRNDMGSQRARRNSVLQSAASCLLKIVFNIIGTLNIRLKPKLKFSQTSRRLMPHIVSPGKQDLLSNVCLMFVRNEKEGKHTLRILAVPWWWSLRPTGSETCASKWLVSATVESETPASNVCIWKSGTAKWRVLCPLDLFLSFPPPFWSLLTSKLLMSASWPNRHPRSDGM